MCIVIFLLTSGHFGQFLIIRTATLDRSLILYPLGALETCGPNKTFSCWVRIISFITKYSKLKMWKGSGIRKEKTQFISVFNCAILIKIERMYQFSKDYTLIGWKLKIGILTWSQVSQVLFFTVFKQCSLSLWRYTLPKYCHSNEVIHFQSLAFCQIDPPPFHWTGANKTKTINDRDLKLYKPIINV